ncbi:ARM repeat-containing protein [Piedraia hortae CBS 480.64]|uniref:ARM repeat-containing protein n=1 Tax=Piedraia hortae CBS 480.64 TaxID=1314780 RepID=A0A6A7C2Z3_9PEZI|nr:ARM repeat-containing protein [Piedraia hortae CBS 480.64]
MEAQAAELLAMLKRPAAQSQHKMDAMNALKAEIRHGEVPESVQSTIFECLKLAVAQHSSSTLALLACSTLSPLVKRLRIQDPHGRAIVHLAPRLLPVLLEKLADLKEPMRAGASHALSDLYPFLTADVEQLIRDDAIGGSHARAKEAGILWVARMHKDRAMPFKAYVSAIVARLEDHEGNVRETAKTALIELFSDAPDRAKLDLKRQLKAHSVRHSIQSQILAQIGSETAAPPARPRTRGDGEQEAAEGGNLLPPGNQLSHSLNSEAAHPPTPEPVQMDPVTVYSERDLTDIFRDMLPFFEGKEDEENWIPRDKSVVMLRRLLKGNAPSQYHPAFMAGIKSLLEGILKVANSLRTTMSTNGTQLVQELARTLGPALDPTVEILLQNFIKMSSNTKPIAAQNGRTTCDALFQHCSYNRNMMQHIWYASQDKNVQIRQCVPEWLKTILNRQAGYQHHFEISGGLELAEKTIKKGLEDAKPAVKEGMRATYWVFAKSWPERAEKLINSLDSPAKTALQKHPGNPNAGLHKSLPTTGATGLRSATSRQAMRDMIAEQRKAKAHGRVPDRPNSAMAQLSPAKPRSYSTVNHAPRAPSHLHPDRVTSNVSAGAPDNRASSTSKRSALMSGPARRPRRPEIARPQTADPYASRRMLRPATPANGSPGGDSPRPSKTSASGLSATKGSTGVRQGASPRHTASPRGSPRRRSPMPGLSRSVTDHVQTSRPTSKGSNAPRSDDASMINEDDLTMVIPSSKNGLGIKRPGLQQAMSADSSLHAPSDDDGFTMVMPTMTSHQPRTQSPLATRTPLKAMFDQARDKLDRNSPMQRHGMPEVASEPQSAVTTQAEEIPIYEDPFVTGAGTAPMNGDRKVLGEIKVNENARVASPINNGDSSESAGTSPQPLNGVEPSPQERADLHRSKKLLSSGIERIRNKSLDVHGFRRVQDLAKSKQDIWDGGKRYDELMTVLLDYLQTFDTIIPTPPKATSLKTQAMILMRTLLTRQRKHATAWQAKALVTVFACQNSTTISNGYFATDVEKTADEIVRTSQPEVCIDATLDFLGQDQGDGAVAMALYTLRRLVETTKARSSSVELETSVRTRLTSTAAANLCHADAEVRKADVELASELFELFAEKNEFWDAFKGTDEGRLGLLTYYIAKRGKGQ